MKIIFYGDPHKNFEPLFQAVENHHPEAVIIVGDFELDKPLDVVLSPILNRVKLYYIHGNHDTDTNSYFNNLFNSRLASRNISGKVVEIAGIRVAALGGVFRGKIWSPPQDIVWHDRETYMRFQPSSVKKESQKFGGLPRTHNSTIWPGDYEALAKESADILVVHEAPTSMKFGFEAIDDLAFSLGVSHVFHGHHHQQYQDVLTRGDEVVTVEGIGLAMCKDEMGNTVE